MIKELFMGKEIKVNDNDFDLEVLQSKIPVFVDISGFPSLTLHRK